MLAPGGVEIKLIVGWLDPSQTVKLDGTVTVGVAITVKVDVVKQPLLSVYVIVVVPELTGETTPELIVATDILLDVHGLKFAAVPLPDNVVVELPVQTEGVPEMVGIGLTTTEYVTGRPVQFDAVGVIL
jgi:hypothetical protein